MGKTDKPHMSTDKTQKLGEELDIGEIEMFSIKKDGRLSTAERILYNIMIIMEEIKEELKEEIRMREFTRDVDIIDNEVEKEFCVKEEEKEAKKPEKYKASKRKKPTDISKIKGK